MNTVQPPAPPPPPASPPQSFRRPPPANSPPGFRPINRAGRMTTVQLVASIKRHFPFLWPAETELFAATTAELRAISCSHEIARRMGARLPGAQS